jgi:hypothetical protein
MDRTCDLYGEENKYPEVFLGKSEGKRPLGKLSHRWEDNIIYLRVVEWGGPWTGFIWFRIWRNRGLF